MSIGDCFSHTTYAHTDRNDLSRNSIECLCGGTNLHLPKDCRELRIDFSTSGFMSITQLVGLTQLMRDAKKTMKSLRVKKPGEKIEGYLMRMNLYRIAGIKGEEVFRRHNPHGNFVPMMELSNDEQHQLAIDLIRDVIFEHLAYKNWGGGTVLDMSLGEVMDNVKVHALSLSGGLVGAQYYPSSSIVEICVADSGRGIVASMCDNPRYSSYSPDAIMLHSLEEGYGQYYGRTAFSGEHTSAGKGLTYPTRLTQAVDGRMWVVSHHNAVEVSQAGITTLDGLYYPGTLISMRLPVVKEQVIYADQIFTGALHMPIQWTPEEGWVDQFGRQVDIYGVTGSDDGLW